MKPAPEWQGLVFPDAYVTKFFFKNCLNSKSGNLLDLGCGNGNNARLFAEYGWHVTGIDVSASALADAQANWSNEPPDSYEFINHDLRDGLPHFGAKFTVMLANASLYYFETRYLTRVLEESRSLLESGSLVYFRFRTPEDWRFGKGEIVERNTYLLNTTATGEEGATMSFFRPRELCKILDSTLGPLQSRQVLLDSHQNTQNRKLIDNHDVVIWGRIA